jgi:hypothetical protein
MSWLIALSVAQLIMLCYIAVRCEQSLGGTVAAEFTDMILARLRAIEKRPPPGGLAREPDEDSSPAIAHEAPGLRSRVLKL